MKRIVTSLTSQIGKITSILSIARTLQKHVFLELILQFAFKTCEIDSLHFRRCCDLSFMVLIISRGQSILNAGTVMIGSMILSFFKIIELRRQPRDGKIRIGFHHVFA